MAKKKRFIEPDFVCFDFLLLLHAHALASLTDAAFTQPMLSSLRRRMKEEQCAGIVYRPQRLGVAYFITGRVVDDYFKHIQSFSDNQGRRFYDVFRILEIFRGAWRSSTCGYIRPLDRHTKSINQLAAKVKNANPDEWCNLAIDVGVPLLEVMATSCRRSKDYAKIRHLYGMALADRLLHDRHICAHISGLLLWLAPSDKHKNALPFVKRVKLPNRVARMVIARDRGKCSGCHTNIMMELLAKPHIDHIIPLSTGGCNDVVNLQLYCEACNLRKSNRVSDSVASVPRYHEGNYFVGIDL